MATNVFVSFRFSDGNDYKQRLEELFENSGAVINYSEDEDRSDQTEETIQKYLYGKLKETSVTIVILTPDAVSYKKDCFGQMNDWMYDELRYSLEDREDNRTNGAVALYTEEAKALIIEDSVHSCYMCNHQQSKLSVIRQFDNLVRKNMMNVKGAYKYNKCVDAYDQLHDSYISLVQFSDFIKDHQKYIDNAINKRDRIDQFELTKRI